MNCNRRDVLGPGHGFGYLPRPLLRSLAKTVVVRKSTVKYYNELVPVLHAAVPQLYTTSSSDTRTSSSDTSTTSTSSSPSGYA